MEASRRAGDIWHLPSEEGLGDLWVIHLTHSEASHLESEILDRGTGGEAGHPRHQALLCSFEGAEIIAKLESRGSRGFREYPRGCRPSTTK